MESRLSINELNCKRQADCDENYVEEGDLVCVCGRPGWECDVTYLQTAGIYGSIGVVKRIQFEDRRQYEAKVERGESLCVLTVEIPGNKTHVFWSGAVRVIK